MGLVEVLFLTKFNEKQFDEYNHIKFTSKQNQLHYKWDFRDGRYSDWFGP